MKKLLSALAILALGATSAAAQNALKNFSFEAPTTITDSSPGKWFRFDSGANGDSAESTAMPRGGVRHIALQTIGSNQFAGVFQNLENPAVPGTALPISPGTAVTYTGWHKAVGVSNQTSEIKFQWTGATQNRLDIINVSAGAYTKFSHSGVAPAGTTGLVVSYTTSTFGAGQSGNSLVYVDDFRVTIGANLGFSGDYNDDQKVDAADYVLWRKHAGTATALPNDPTGGTIGASQYNAWRANFGSAAGSGAASTAIPEPSAYALLAVVLCAPIVRNHRKPAVHIRPQHVRHLRTALGRNLSPRHGR